MGAEPHLMVIHCKMGDAPAELEQFLARISVALVLLDRVLDGLLREAILQLESCDRQTVDEEREVERIGIGFAVAQLAGHRKPVPCETLGCLRVAGRGRGIEQCDIMGPVLEAAAQDIDDPAFGDLTLKPGKEFLPGRRNRVEIQGRRKQGLRLCQKGG
jgi:hypothetical protein